MRRRRIRSVPCAMAAPSDLPPIIARQITATSHYRHANMAQQMCSDILEQAVCSKLPDGRRPPVQALH